MAATPVISMLAARAALDAITAKLNVGGTAGTIEIRTGAAEATTLTADSGTLLATLTLSTTSFPGSADGVSNGLATATASAITSATAVASGTAGHFRAKSSAGTVIVQGTVGTATADMILNTTTITSGDNVACTSWVITLPDGTGSD
jgi:hypothetical protein